MLNGFWSCSPSNIGKTLWAANEGGIPDPKPYWRKGVGRYGLMSDLCLTDTAIYALSAGDILSVDLLSGSVIWENLFQDRGSKGNGICINGQYLCAGWYMLKGDSGEVVIDFRELFHAENIGEYSFVVPYEDGFIRNFELPQGKGCYFISPSRKEAEFLGCDIKGVARSGQVDGVICGWQSNAIKAFDVRSRKYLWEIDVPLKSESKHASSAGFCMLKDQLIMQLWSTSLRSFNIGTGQLIWEYTEQNVPVSRDAQNYAAYQSDILAACDDRIYIGKSRRKHGWLQCHDINGGDFLWRVDAPESMSLCIAGDLLFGVRDASVLVAWDRYTGQEVWHAKDPMTAAYHVMAAGKKVIYSATTGEVRCFEWTEPYISSAK